MLEFWFAICKYVGYRSDLSVTKVPFAHLVRSIVRFGFRNELQKTRSFHLNRDNPMQMEAAPHRIFNIYPLRSRKVEAIQVHHFVPCRHKVTHERCMRIAAGIDFGERPQL